MTAIVRSKTLPASAGGSLQRLARRHAGLLQGFVGFVAVALLLELLSRAGIFPSYLVPPFSTVLVEAVQLPFDATFMEALGTTLVAALLGLAISFVVGALLGVLLGSFDLAYRASSLVLEFVRPIPSVAVLPVALLVLGVGIEMKVVLVMLAAVWPVLFNAIYGVHSVQPLAVDTARAYGESKFGVLTRVVLPSTLPFIYTGLRIATTLALLLVISVEVVTGSSGVGGWLMLMGGEAQRPDLLYAGLIVTGTIGLVMNTILVAGERRFFAWKPSEQG